MANPNPARITDELWAVWEGFAAHEPSVRLGGIYADKPGYHNTRDGNKTLDYSVRDPQDQLGPSDKAAAIDLTFPDAQAGRYDTIDLYSSRLLASGVDPADPRGDYLREFYGQADADTAVEGWDFRYLRTVTSDSSHLWHIHISISREHVANPEMTRALLSILKGETVAQWQAGGEDMTPEQANQALVTFGREEAQIRHRPSVVIGPTAGESNEQYAVLEDIRARLAKLETGGVDVKALATAIVADPAFKAALAQAAFEGAQRAETQ